MVKSVRERLDELARRLEEDPEFQKEFSTGFVQYANQRHVRHVYGMGPLVVSEIHTNQGPERTDYLESGECGQGVVQGWQQWKLKM